MRGAVLGHIDKIISSCYNYLWKVIGRQHMSEIKLPEPDWELRLMMKLAPRAHLEHKRKYPQWALDEELEKYGTHVINRVGLQVTQDLYNIYLEYGLSEQKAINATRDRVLFNIKL